MQEYVYFHKPSVPEYSFYDLIQKSQPIENTTQFEEEGGICENEDAFFPPSRSNIGFFFKGLYILSYIFQNHSEIRQHLLINLTYLIM